MEQALILKLYAQVCNTAQECGLPDVPANATSFQTILSMVFTLTGALAVGFIVYGGFRYVISTGSPDETKKAKDIIVYAVVGLIVSLMAFSIVRFVLSRFA